MRIRIYTIYTQTFYVFFSRQLVAFCLVICTKMEKIAAHL